ncbi:hypothetical protein [Nitrosomonas sp. Nm34]|uniref:hypothetical protein n=1 Tax=Nitrosomonas sp. Nm34 TaxID=1881055 RepID=UPI0008EF2036|nr:hypothetical protein [Nitrosomonas sp. Nm34]SFI31206.1 hypothetical protein SAMN05428978_100556 [Nitrosomonas sp. Nm34]
MATISIEQQIEQVKRDLNQVAQKQVPFAIRLTVNKLAENAKKNFDMKELPRIDRPTRYAANMMRVQYATKTDLTSTIRVKTKSMTTKRGGFAPDEVLRHLFEGGRRINKGFEKLMQQKGMMPNGWFAVPGEGVRLDQYGNIPRTLLTQLLAYFRAFQESGFRANMTDKGKKAFERRAARDHFAAAQLTRFFTIQPGDRSKLHPGIWSKSGFFAGGKIRISRTPKPILMFVNAAHYQRMFNLPEVVERIVNRDLNLEFNKAMEHALKTAK